MSNTVVVMIVLAIFNFIGSIIQGVAGIGDAIFLQVLWYMACEVSPSIFNATPLGPEPVRAVALLMYIRLLFMAPLVVYLGYSESVFSRSMVIAMAIPSTILSLLGVFLFSYLNGNVLKLVLGISSLIFAVMYAFILGFRALKKRRQKSQLVAHHVKLVKESDAVAEEAHMSRNASFATLHNSFVHQVPNNSVLLMHLPSEETSASPNRLPIVVDPETGIPQGSTEAFVSTIKGDIFVANEASAPTITENNVPPLTTELLSPSGTLTYTRVRVNRNLDANGKIKLSTKIGASVAASIAGIMASLTGVNAPPQIIFILLYDAPNYIVRVNFSAMTIPGGLVRFVIAIGKHIFTWEQVPYFVNTIIFGYAGVIVGNRIGRLLGPIGFNVFVLCLLLLSSLVMITSSVGILVFFTVATVVITVGVAYWENKRNKPVVAVQREHELEIEKRVYDAMEELQRGSFVYPSADLQRLQRATRPKPLWGNFDNDDDVENREAAESSHPPSPPSGHADKKQKATEVTITNLSPDAKAGDAGAGAATTGASTAVREGAQEGQHKSDPAETDSTASLKTLPSMELQTPLRPDSTATYPPESAHTVEDTR